MAIMSLQKVAVNELQLKKSEKSLDKTGRQVYNGNETRGEGVDCPLLRGQKMPTE